MILILLVKKEKFNNLEFQVQRLRDSLSSFTKREKKKILQALKVARESHEGQSRYEGAPYLIHPVRVALILLSELKKDDNPNLIMAVLLHDVPEDCDMDIEEIEEKFGPETARLVKGVYRPRPDDETETEKAESKMNKIRKVAAKDRPIRLLALCDVLDNMRSSNYIPENNPAYEKIPRWQKELKNWLPVASKTNQELFLLLADQLN